MRDYELTYIIKPDLEASALSALVERINGFVTADGGSIVKTNQWGVRHLAYPIRRYREGHYVFSVIQLEATALARIEGRLRLQEDVLRYLLVRADDASDTTSGEPDVMGGQTDAPAAPATPAAPVATTVETPPLAPVPAPAAIGNAHFGSAFETPAIHEVVPTSEPASEPAS